tara:strand:+ start:34242 stop:34694 length:453 start_codon:yes stop_codon:yes gene_type:complete
MKETSHLLRASYLSILRPLIVEGVTIPIFDNRVNPEVTIPKYRGGDCYVVITNQTSVDTTNNRCSFRKTSSITLEINTKYPLNYGGGLARDLISNTIQQQIRLLQSNSVSLIGFQVLSTRVEFDNDFTENGLTESNYRKVLAFSHSIYEL